jgi:hypothetical protein
MSLRRVARSSWKRRDAASEFIDPPIARQAVQSQLRRMRVPWSESARNSMNATG